MAWDETGISVAEIDIELVVGRIEITEFGHLTACVGLRHSRRVGDTTFEGIGIPVGTWQPRNLVMVTTWRITSMIALHI